MTKADLVEQVAEAIGPGITKKDCALVVDGLLNAIKKACDAGKGTIANRKLVIRNVKKINLKTTLLGGPFRFSTKSNDPLNAKFYIFQIQSNGSYKLVG